MHKKKYHANLGQSKAANVEKEGESQSDMSQISRKENNQIMKLLSKANKDRK